MILGHAALGALAGTQRSSVATSDAPSSDHWNRLNSANRRPSAILEDMLLVQMGVAISVPDIRRLTDEPLLEVLNGRTYPNIANAPVSEALQDGWNR